MERVKYNGTIKPNLATNSSAKSFIVSVDPNSNNAVSWNTGYHFNDVNARGPVHSNGLTSSKVTGSRLNSFLYNNDGWNATHYNRWTIAELANATIDPYTYQGKLYNPIKNVDLTIYSGSSGSVVFRGPGYAGPLKDVHDAYFLQPAGNPGAAWAKRAFTDIPFYLSSLLNPSPSTIYFNDVSPIIPKSQSLAFSSLSFPSSITGNPTTTVTVGSYGVADGYTASNVSLSPFRMKLAVINTTGNWSYCYIPLRVVSSSFFTFIKNSSNNNRFELSDHITLYAHPDRECLRLCQNYLKAGISSGLFNGDTKSYFPMLEWEPGWKFSSLPGGGTGDASLGNAVFRTTWSVYNSNQYQVSGIEQIQ